MIFSWSFWTFHDIPGPGKYGFSCSVASEFNNFFIDIGPELVKGIPKPAKPFGSYVSKSNAIMSIGLINVNELKKTFFSIKTNKKLIIRSCFSELCGSKSVW